MSYKHKLFLKILSFMFTGLNGLTGLLGIYFVFKGDIYWPLRLIIIGAGFDFLDGYFARKSNLPSRIGAYIDSFADAITYVCLPSCILMIINQKIKTELTFDLFAFLIALFYLLCGFYRLFRFIKNPTVIYFEGLPSSIAALTVSSLSVLIATSPPQFGIFYDTGLHISIFIVFISFLMITKLHYPSHISYTCAYGILRVLGYCIIVFYVILSNFWTSLSVFGFFLFYTLTGPFYLRASVQDPELLE
ncbi:MAG: CDP-alcohol phosphatidyltransferase family protein [Candidatus Hodarchaeota archaeon]